MTGFYTLAALHAEYLHDCLSQVNFEAVILGNKKKCTYYYIIINDLKKKSIASFTIFFFASF